MRRFVLMLVALAVLALATSVGLARATYTDNGYTYTNTCPNYACTPNQVPFSGVTIYNNTTGARGSTNSNSNGFYSVGGLVAGYSYSFSGGPACYGGFVYDDHGYYVTFTQPSSSRLVYLKEWWESPFTC